MSEAGPSTQPPAVGDAGQGKKRKRTGKEREERKQAAILAAQAEKEEAAAAPATTEEVDGAVDIAAEAQSEEKSASEEAPVTPAAPEVDVDRLSKRLPTALKHLNPVFKRAKTMETTRLIKKVKALKSKTGSETELADLEAQRQLLAHLPVGPTLSRQLLTNLRKHRLFKHNPTLIPSTVIETLSPEPTSHDAEILKKVENRICSSKTAADEMKRAVAWLMGEEGSKLGGPGKKAGEAPTPVKSAKKGKKEVEDDDEADDEMDSSRRNVVVDSDDEGSDEGDEVDEAGWESGSVSGGDENIKPSARLAPDSDSEGDESVPVRPTKKTKTKEVKAKPSKTQPQPSKKLTSSTFLPSLSTGFTRGGSDDSDPDDDFGEGLEDIIGKGKTGERKNRRGQQARRAIWERKYGKNAKHVQKASEQATEGNIAKAYGNRSSATAAPATGKPSDRSATAGARPPPTGARPPPTGARPPSTFTPSARPAFTPTTRPAAPAPATEALHPSWEAARLRKQREAEGPKATKIVFD